MYICIISVYNEELSNLYVHHDILLPSFPLAVEWLDYDIAESEPGRFLSYVPFEKLVLQIRRVTGII